MHDWLTDAAFDAAAPALAIVTAIAGRARIGHARGGAERHCGIGARTSRFGKRRRRIVPGS